MGAGLTTETIGQRLVRLRHENGLTQGRLAEAVGMSDSYVSLIEAGKRTPSRRALERLAERLGCAVDYLADGRGDDAALLELELGFAELALRSGDAQAARDRCSDVLHRAREAGLPDIAAAASFCLSIAHEALGDLRVAMAGLQQLADDPGLPLTVDRFAVLTVLCRTAMGCGDVNRAVEIGESALREHRAAGGQLTEKPIELVAMLVACYYERGDVNRAQMLIDDAMAAAEQLGSLRARASAYWNAALVAEGQGDVRVARRLIDRALAIYGELENAWALAMLRGNRGRLLLCGEEPRYEEARTLLERALGELAEIGSPGEAAEAQADLARCHLLAGDVHEAVHIANEAVARAERGSVIDSAKARIVLADALLASGHAEEAIELYRAAATDLDRAGASRRAAAAWRQLALALRRLDRLDDALNAYERLADVSGVPAPFTSTSRARVAG
ncbi:MAG: helix-turn-helix domain-containing protein [Frankiaceae bacterium]